MHWCSNKANFTNVIKRCTFKGNLKMHIYEVQVQNLNPKVQANINLGRQIRKGDGDWAIRVKSFSDIQLKALVNDCCKTNSKGTVCNVPVFKF